MNLQANSLIEAVLVNNQACCHVAAGNLDIAVQSFASAVASMNAYIGSRRMEAIVNAPVASVVPMRIPCSHEGASFFAYDCIFLLNPLGLFISGAGTQCDSLFISAIYNLAFALHKSTTGKPRGESQAMNDVAIQLLSICGNLIEEGGIHSALAVALDTVAKNNIACYQINYCNRVTEGVELLRSLSSSVGILYADPSIILEDGLRRIATNIFMAQCFAGTVNAQAA